MIMNNNNTNIFVIMIFFNLMSLIHVQITGVKLHKV